MLAQQGVRVLLPRRGSAVGVLQGLQTLHIAGECSANVTHRICGIAL